MGRYKGVVKRCDRRPRATDVFEVYDLLIDPSEKDDVAKEKPLVVGNMKASLLKQNISCKCYQCGVGLGFGMTGSFS